MHIGGPPGIGEGIFVAHASKTGIAGIPGIPGIGGFPGHWPPRCLFDVLVLIPPYRVEIFA
jgi:hypothetical protein